MLYHYTSYDSLIKIVTSRAIWASNIHYLNDGSEFAYAVNLLREHLGSLEVREPFRRTFFNIVRARLSADERANVFVASFSENGDLLSQWRAYCPASRGVSLGIESWRLAKVCHEQRFTLVACIYDIAQQRSIIEQQVNELLALHDASTKSDETMQSLATIFSSEFRRLAPQFKDPAFLEEQEWRLVSEEFPPSHPQIQYRQGLSFIVPYFEFRLPVDDDLLEFDEFVVGPTPHRALAEESLTALLRARCVEWNQLRSSRVPYRAW